MIPSVSPDRQQEEGEEEETYGPVRIRNGSVPVVEEGDSETLRFAKEVMRKADLNRSNPNPNPRPSR